MMHVAARKNADAMFDIVEKYLGEGGTEPIDLDALAKFAINRGLWAKTTGKMLQLCKQEFSQAFREQYHVDPQGRHVRTYHAAMSRDGGRQHVFWADMRSAPGEHTEAAFQQRRSQIVGDCRQLKCDVDSYNENNTHGGHYQLSLDFRDDVAEREQPTQYRPNKPR
jgi:hypothetical protein